MDAITQSEYFTQCQAIAVEAVKEAEGDRDRVYDSINETVDSHQWIIYTYYNLQVLTHSDHAEAYFDDMDVLETSSFGETMMRLAAYAMLADVSEYLEKALTEYKETQQESESAHE